MAALGAAAALRRRRALGRRHRAPGPRRAAARRLRLGPIDLELAWGERVALVGPNGSGKTTLVDALLGRLPLAAGTRWVGPGVRIGVLDQTRDGFDGATALLDAFVARSGLTQQEARSLLAKFGLEQDAVGRAAHSLSPGERTRASLALLMASGANCLVLDEPTNHLDLPAIEQLETALDAYDGTLLLVTHDRQLLEAVELDRTIELTASAFPSLRRAPPAPASPPRGPAPRTPSRGSRRRGSPRPREPTTTSEAPAVRAAASSPCQGAPSASTSRARASAPASRASLAPSSAMSSATERK